MVLMQVESTEGEEWLTLCVCAFVSLSVLVFRSGTAGIMGEQFYLQSRIL